MPFASDQERGIAVAVITALMSEKYKGKNYLFLDPFDISQVPGYLETVGPPLDLKTVSNDIDSYNETTFYTKIGQVFQNAIKYHGDKPTKWIAKFAKDMLKAVNKERKIAAGGGEKKKSAKLKLKLPKGDGGPAVTKTKLKLPTMAAAAAGGNGPPKPKLKLKIGSGASEAKTVPKKAKPTKTKLKLKLSLGAKSKSTSVPKKKKEEDGEITEPPAPTASPAASAASSSPTPILPPAPSVVKINPNPGPRGKELPEGVANAMPPPAKSTSTAASKSKSAAKPKSTKGAAKPKKPKKSVTSNKKTAAMAAVSASGTGPLPKTATFSGGSSSKSLDAAVKKHCLELIFGLKRRQNKKISWFLTPVSDKNILPDYKSKIKHPMDLQTIQAKLEKGSYKKLETFCLDLRRVFANALRYNTSIKDSLRPVAVQVLQTVERLAVLFLARHGHSYPPLLYCWKVCIDILDTLYNLVNPSDGQPMAYYFLHPVSVYCGGQFPADYLEKVTKPMDFGTVTANLVEGRYQTVDAFASDCRLVVQNCETYYSGRLDGKVFVDQAMRLNDILSTQLAQLARYDKSNKAATERKKMVELTNPAHVRQELILPNQPPAALFLSVLEDMRALKYTDRGTKITEPAMAPFEKPISLASFPDYAQFVSEPMDLSTVEKKVKANATYETPEEFEYDINLVFKNCEVYNSRRNAQHSVAMAKFAARKFRSIFYSKIQAYEDPTAVSPSKTSSDTQSQASTSQSYHAPPAKKIKVDVSTNKGKLAPRISLSASQISSATTARAKSPQPQKKTTQAKDKANAPVPLHIAIARVKEAFPLRRAVKSLQSWEADCARYFKEFLRHPWITAARPKYIFHVPVPILFPDLRESYAAKIKKPMDLTTIECTLLAGNRYAGPEDFLQDVGLVFANAVRYNRDGKDLGDVLSCAYYNASIHLVRYARWLSLELLSSHIDMSSEHTDDTTADGLPPFSWKLTDGNRQIARKETEKISCTEPLEKSLEGDRFTWMEAECEKLLKALRHQSDLRHMQFFIQPNYPADYTAFISKPMDWEKVQRTLKKRQYETIAEMIDDLRLIFSNALKYNSRLKGTDTVSGRAYEAAKIMSFKLESAVNKLLLSVSDKLDRERIDHANAEREIEAADRAEEAEIRAAWKKDPDKDGSSPTPMRSDMFQKTRVVRKLPQRKQPTDFEIPFFDEEDDGQHERSYFEVVKFQKSMFEKQRQDLIEMRKTSRKIGSSVLSRLIRINKIDAKCKKDISSSPVPMDIDKSSKDGSKESNPSEARYDEPSSVLGELERKDRGPLQMILVAKTGKKKAGKKRIAFQGFD